jgi:hypothetical protein
MEPSEIYDLIDQTGIETLFGAVPLPLPKLDAAALQSRFDIDDKLVQTDGTFNQTWKTLSEPEAVVRIHRHGLENDAAAVWVFVRSAQLVQLSSDLQPSKVLQLSSLADSAALANEIAHLLAMPAMPKEAYARAVLDRGDAENIFDLSQGSGFVVGAELLVSDGLTEEEARVAFDTIRSASVAGRISFMAVRSNKVILTCGIAVGKAGADVWMVSAEPASSKQLVLETAMAGALHRKLVDGWTSLSMD